MSNAVEMNKDNWSDIVTEGKTALVDFYAPWCMPCKMMAPFLDQIAKEQPSVTVAKLDVDSCPEIAAKYNVTAVPTIILFRDGAEAKRAVGQQNKAALTKLVAE